MSSLLLHCPRCFQSRVFYLVENSETRCECETCDYEFSFSITEHQSGHVERKPTLSPEVVVAGRLALAQDVRNSAISSGFRRENFTHATPVDRVEVPRARRS